MPELADTYFNEINLENLKIPIQSRSQCDEKRRQGTALGKLTLLKMKMIPECLYKIISNLLKPHKLL